jgi:hypothetical protein
MNVIYFAAGSCATDWLLMTACQQKDYLRQIIQAFCVSLLITKHNTPRSYKKLFI